MERIWNYVYYYTYLFEIKTSKIITYPFSLIFDLIYKIPFIANGLKKRGSSPNELRSVTDNLMRNRKYGQNINFSNIHIGGLLVLIEYGLFNLLQALLAKSLIQYIKDFKYIIIDKQRNLIKYYSILRPIGHTLKLDDFDNKIKTSETSVRGEYEVVYLVKKGYTAFKINGLFYDNFKEIDSSIKLQRIYSYKFNLKLYLQLLFTGKIKIEE
ncbi:hypothetical protein [Chryseobacterium gallinarum]|uniref:Uncharacterized protein n=1 Tax=Chryseobacterium gallinarum TaxID=1324352 RepID=A0ABX6KPI2_CHRGL|nr:hypothetical protein [Chryseobacterium gallinarum]QIY90531.1 hypothetical protein FOB44_07575 [Chryseobacterium gallinarum]